MGNDWEPVRLGDLITIKHGWPFKSEFFSEEPTGCPIVVNIGNFQYTGGFRFESTTTKEYRGPYPPEYELSPGDILLVMTCQTSGGEILGIPGRIPTDNRVYLHNQRLGKVVVRHPELVAPDYLYWLFMTQSFNQELFTTASGSKILHTSPGRIEEFRFRLPPLPEQRTIAHILGTLDDKIELNRRMNETLEAMARALFKSWFVDFDPVCAKMEGRQPVGMDAETAALFPDALEDSPLGEIPKGWRVGCLGDVAENPRRGVDPRDIADGTPYIGLEHMPRKSIALSDWGPAEDLESNKFQFCAGDILFGKLRPYFHKVGVAVVGGVCSTDILVIVPQQSSWFAFVLGHVSSDEFVQYTDQSSTGTKMPRTNWADMARYPICLPNTALVQAFDWVITPLVALMQSNVHESRTLAAIGDALLPKLLSGEIRIED